MMKELRKISESRLCWNGGMVDTLDSKSSAERCKGSSPFSSTMPILLSASRSEDFAGSKRLATP